jgi:gliding motility-associated-like protein
MQKAFLTKLLLCTCLLLVGIVPFSAAQQCTSFGDPVVNITFGAGANPGPPFPAASLAYSYVGGDCPQDGSYTVRNSTFNCNGNTWHNISSDHTGDRNGYFMLINASYNPGDFYLDTVKGLCANTTYRFSAWIANVLVPSACNSAGIHPNITFRIESTAGGVPLALIQSGDIPVAGSAVWQEYGLDFTTPAGVSEIVLRMTNNAPGGCGNDLALDDITFRPCGPRVQAGITGSNGSDTVGFCVDAQTPQTFTGAVSPGYNAPRYQWQTSQDTGRNWSDIPGQTNTTYTRLPGGPAAFYQYRLVVGEGTNIILPTCRVSSNFVTVQVNPKPVPKASNDGPACEGDTIILSASDGASYAWAGPGSFTATGEHVTMLNVNPLESGQYQVLVTSAYGCTQTGVTTVLAYPRPVARFAPAGAACEKTLFSLVDQSSALAQTVNQWKWYFGDGDSSVAQNPDHIYATPGNYDVGLLVTTDRGCTNLINKVIVTVHDKPRPDFGLPRICITDPQALFSDSSSIPDGTEAAFTWQWDFGEPASGAANTSVQKNGTHQYQLAGPYSVTLKVTSGVGCIADTLKSFVVNGDNPQAHFTIANAARLCSNQPVILTDASTVSPGSIIRTEVYWDYQNDPTVKTQDDQPSFGETYAHAYTDFSAPGSLNYRLQYVVYSGENCMNLVDQPITVLASPRTVFDPLSNVCEEIPVFPLTDGHEVTGFAGLGAYSGRGVSSLGFFNPRLAGPGPDTLHYTFSGANGCMSNADQTIFVYPQPRADAGPAVYILQGEPGILDGSGSGNNIRFSWSPADSVLSGAAATRPSVSPYNDLVYTLTVTSADGCVDSSQVKVFVLEVPVVPNAFSPNGDGINDTWVIRYLSEYPSADVQVFNRWGQSVYHVVGYTTPWDGMYKGQALPVGTYYWVIRPGNGRRVISGSVTILR